MVITDTLLEMFSSFTLPSFFDNTCLYVTLTLDICSFSGLRIVTGAYAARESLFSFTRGDEAQGCVHTRRALTTKEHHSLWFYLREGLSIGQSWSWIHCVAQTGHQLVIVMPLPPCCWDYRRMTPYLVRLLWLVFSVWCFYPPEYPQGFNFHVTLLPVTPNLEIVTVSKKSIKLFLAQQF